MTSITLRQINTALTTAFADVATITGGLGVIQDLDEFTEAINDTPLLQIYPESLSQDVSGNTDRTTFGAHTRQTEAVFHLDYYARRRSHIDEDVVGAIDGADAMIAILEAQDVKPYFGLAGIKAFSWSGQRVMFSYGSQDSSILFAGFRIVLTLRIF